MSSLHYYNILITKPFNRPFTYGSEHVLNIGDLVMVNFNHREIIGVVESRVEQVDIDKAKIKPILEVLEFKIPPHYMQFLKFCSQYNMVEMGSFLKMMLSHAEVLKKFEKYVLDDIVMDDIKKSLASLNDEQNTIYHSISEQINKFSVSVLQGVTGSGKTEVYLNLAAEIIKNGGQVLILLPEIALGSQLIERYEERLGIKPLIWNSKEGNKSKKITWYNSVIKNYPLIVGARSALFVPMKNLKMIIIDEEHDQSFKQEEGVHYNARDMAVLLAKLLEIPLLLASATPSIETIFNAKNGKYDLYEIKSRYGNATLPDIKIIDTSKEKLDSGVFISKTAIKTINEQLEQKQQILIYLNRRGYAPVSFCGGCGFKYECPSCTANLVKHKYNEVLICHYCGYKSCKIKECPNCKITDDIFAYGPGVERIEEEVKSTFPDARVLVFSSDTTKQASVKNLVKEIKDGEYDIIIGTQMITKGFHFPKLSTVLILDFDWSVKGFDLRAHEKAYQSLYQVSGRAGREEKKGQVLVQTIEPDSHLLEVLKNNSHREFVDTELSEREMANMPPYSSIGIVNFEANYENTILRYTRELDDNIFDMEGVRILGPSQAPIFKLKNKFRYRYILVSNSKNNKLQSYIAKWLNMTPKPRQVKVKIDIDPMSFS